MNYYEDKIYIQTAYQGVRNKDILNVNTSSDMCTFDAPNFTISGASKIPCDSSFSALTTGTSYVTIISTATTKEITFDFTGNTDSFSATNATFNYQIFKYDNTLANFHNPPQYRSAEIEWSTFSGTSALTQSIALTSLRIDGEYLIKGNFVHDVCTEYANRLGYTYDTSSYVSGKEFGLYNPASDFYMLIMNEAETPVFSNIIDNGATIGAIKQYSIIPTDGQTVFILASNVGLDFVVTLNGLALAVDSDYSVTQYTGGTLPYIVTLFAETYDTDILTIIYTTIGSEIKITTETIDVITIPSGPTDGEGSNNIYLNTTSGKYEAFTELTPRGSNDLLVMINGAILAIGIDYYQSISNPKRIIFEGTILIGDIIVIGYNANATYVGSIDTATPQIYWNINNGPQLVNGEFILEFASDNSMTIVVSSASTDYVVGDLNYNAGVTISGAVGTEFFYRVTNNKNYVTLCGDIVQSTAYSDIIPITITTNSINSY